MPDRFASVVPHTNSLRLYSAFYVSLEHRRTHCAHSGAAHAVRVTLLALLCAPLSWAAQVVRSRCSAHNWHTDYKRSVGTDALTLITPLCDFDETATFQLAYRPSPRPGEHAYVQVVEKQGDQAEEQGAGSREHGTHAGERPVRRYEYTKGRAVVFGSQFEHSTEPGEGRDAQCHAYLCFTFGTDKQEKWAEIERTLGTQSRVVVHPNGEMHLSQLGSQIEELVAAYEQG